jgi:2-polyprenyl-3-methyl-5-hydroxy-6-metoxy-1,4-benzoquinol methylase
MAYACHLCSENELLPLLEFGKHPIAHHFLTDLRQEEYVHAVTLNVCTNCGLIQLSDPAPAEMLYTEYVCLSSWKHQPHVQRMVAIINGLADVTKESRIVEVGSNDGSFLRALRDEGYRNLFGIEPALDAQQAAREDGFETLGTYFTPAVAQEQASTQGKCDLLLARQVLEHIADLGRFGEAIQRLLRPGGYVLIEVPNFDFNLDVLDYSGIWEEHVNYFTLDTMSRYLAGAGIQVVHSETALFSGETLIVLGEYLAERIATSTQKADQSTLRAIEFRNRWPDFRQGLSQFLQKLRDERKRIAIYGAGCRACSLINFAEIGPLIEYVVDDQREKQDKYLPGSRLPILPSEVLREGTIDLCLLAVNAENEQNVIAKHQEYQNAGGNFASILPPSERLLPCWQVR